MEGRNHSMKLGFVSAILADRTLEEVMRFAAAEGFDCIELMCWPAGKAERRYAGVTHIDVTALDEAGVERIRALVEETGVGISGLGYYPNPLAPDEAEGAAKSGGDYGASAGVSHAEAAGAGRDRLGEVLLGVDGYGVRRSGMH
jgi:sugar phosphate isomerase/epimerase